MNFCRAVEAPNDWMTFAFRKKKRKKNDCCVAFRKNYNCDNCSRVNSCRFVSVSVLLLSPCEPCRTFVCQRQIKCGVLIVRSRSRFEVRKLELTLYVVRLARTREFAVIRGFYLVSFILHISFGGLSLLVGWPQVCVARVAKMSFFSFFRCTKNVVLPTVHSIVATRSSCNSSTARLRIHYECVYFILVSVRGRDRGGRRCGVDCWLLCVVSVVSKFRSQNKTEFCQQDFSCLPRFGSFRL